MKPCKKLSKVFFLVFFLYLCHKTPCLFTVESIVTTEIDGNVEFIWAANGFYEKSWATLYGKFVACITKKKKRYITQFLSKLQRFVLSICRNKEISVRKLWISALL